MSAQASFVASGSPDGRTRRDGFAVASFWAPSPTSSAPSSCTSATSSGETTPSSASPSVSAASPSASLRLTSGSSSMPSTAPCGDGARRASLTPRASPGPASAWLVVLPPVHKLPAACRGPGSGGSEPGSGALLRSTSAAGAPYR
eukprot:363133-Chlamydomonas_euryale.AAC.9